MAKYLPESLDDKLAVLWYSVSTELSKYEREYKNKLNAYFSNMQKEVIRNVKSDNLENILDISKNSEKFVNIYSDMVDKLTNFSAKRVIGETQADGDIISMYVNQFKKEYAMKYFSEVSLYVVRTTVKDIGEILNSYKKGEYTLQETIDEISDYFNNECKKRRSRLIAITEVYRMHNIAYMTFMSILGYRYKVYVAKPKTKCPVCSKLHRQVVFYLSDFDTIVVENNKSLINRFTPPLHPQSHAILLMIKEI